MSLISDGNLVTLSDTPNKHVMMIGSSGQGKSFSSCRGIEEDTAKNKKVFVLDYSSSYCEEERRKNGLEDIKGIKEFNLFENPYYFTIKERDDEKFKKDLVDAIVNILGIKGYTQEELLHEGMKRHFENHRTFNFIAFFETLRKFMLEKKSLQERDDVNNLSKLLQRLRAYSDIKNLYVMQSDITGRKEGGVTIIQLSDFPEIQRTFLAEFLVTLLWKETMSNKKCKYDSIYLDEFQHLSMAKGGALYSLLRESRKFDLSVILCSQFIGNYTDDERNALLQVGNILFFRPTPKDLYACAKLIDAEETGTWKRILRNLNIGEAVLLGHYQVNGRKKVNEKPIVCIIQEEKKGKGENVG